MKIGILGTGMVGSTLGSRLVELGHEVYMGSRSNNNPKATEWASTFKKDAYHGTFFEAARFGELLINCTSGNASLEALQLAGRENLSGKTLIDLANPLDFSNGMPPGLFVCNTDSLGEVIQRQFPDAKVVKTLNTMNCQLMVNPSLLKEPTEIFMSGNDEHAKQVAASLLKEFGWTNIIDLGDITTARGTEQLLPIWIRLMSTLGTPMFNFRIVR